MFAAWGQRVVEYCPVHYQLFNYSRKLLVFSTHAVREPSALEQMEVFEGLAISLEAR